MAESTVRDLFRSLEQTLHERLRVIEDVLRMGRGTPTETGGQSNGLEARVMALEKAHQLQTMSLFEEVTRRLAALEDDLDVRRQEKETAAKQHKADIGEWANTYRAMPMGTDPSILPMRPLQGLEVIPKREVAISMEDDRAISLPDRLLLNKKALRALEAQEMGEQPMEDHPSMSSDADEKTEGDGAEAEEAEAEEEVEVEAEEEVEVEAEEEAEAEEAEEKVDAEEEVEVEAEEEAEEEAEAEEAEAEEVELEEFEYKGATYYRDGENQVFMTDEDGELVQDPIGLWSPEKNKILKLKPAA